MTLYHFGNCLALAYVPYHLTYKFSGLSDYGAFYKCVTAGFMYMVTQLVKMLFLATFFPMGSDADLDAEPAAAQSQEVPFVFFTEFLKLTVDLVDLVGIHLVMQRVSGKGHVKVMVAGLGWAFAELVLTRVIFLWVGARGIEFDWRYIQKSFDANISLVHHLTVSCLIWLWMRRDVNKTLLPILAVLIVVCSYKSLLLDSLVHVFGLGVWTALAYKAVVALSLGLVALQLYVGVTKSDKHY